MYYKAPTYNLDTKTWGYTEFESRKDVIKYVDSQVKYPGRYNLKYTEGYWNDQAKFFQKNKSYPVYVKNTQSYKKHWDFEKEKCQFDGFVIYKSEKENLEFPVPGLFYFYLNYCPILDKVKKRNDFPEIYDGDYHYYLYILRCILKGKFAVILKKRQSGYTLKNMSIILNKFWFGDQSVAKTFAYLESKVKDAWILMETYKEHINKYCAWFRNLEPSGRLDWQVRYRKNDGTFGGSHSIAKGFTTKQDHSNGVGGNADIIFGEEAGINPSLGETHEYITSNVSLGALTTGLIIYSGAVGELDKCEPLRKFMENPDEGGFLACDNELEDDVELGAKVGFFAPEWWNYVSVEEDDEGNTYGEALRCFDEWGNTNRELAVSEVLKWRKRAEETKAQEKYRYYVSQRPMSIKEAFQYRKDSKFPLHLVQKQIQRIEDKTYPLEYVDLSYGDDGKVQIKKSEKLPISEFPITAKTLNKEGVVVIHERPIKDPKLGVHYYAAIDPIKTGKVLRPKSLATIYIFKADTQVKKIINGEIKIEIEPGKLVAWWCGRFDDINETHRRLEILMDLYNAWTLVENNVALFIEYMKGRKKQHMLVPKSQIALVKDLNMMVSDKEEYGWTNVGNIFSGHMLNFGIESLSEQLSVETKPNGEPVKVTYGVERISDIMLLKEMMAYHDDLNVDRIIAYCSLMTLVKVQQSARGYAERVEVEDNRVKQDPNLYKKQAGFFKTQQNLDSKYKFQKPLFKNLK